MIYSQNAVLKLDTPKKDFAEFLVSGWKIHEKLKFPSLLIKMGIIFRLQKTVIIYYMNSLRLCHCSIDDIWFV